MLDIPVNFTIRGLSFLSMQVLSGGTYLPITLSCMTGMVFILASNTDNSEVQTIVLMG